MGFPDPVKDGEKAGGDTDLLNGGRRYRAAAGLPCAIAALDAGRSDLRPEKSADLPSV